MGIANDGGPPQMTRGCLPLETTPFREGDNGPTAKPMGASEVVMLDGFRNNAFLSKHERAQEWKLADTIGGTATTVKRSRYDALLM